MELSLGAGWRRCWSAAGLLGCVLVSGSGCAKVVGLDDLGSGPSSGGEVGASGGAAGDAASGGAGSGTGGASGGFGGTGGVETGGTGGIGAGGGGTGGGGTGGLAAGGDAGGGGTAGSSMAGAGGGGSTGCSLSDDFRDEAYTRRCWTLFNGPETGRLRDDYEIDEVNGLARFMPAAVADHLNAWWEEGRGVLLHQPMRGAFRVETTVVVQHEADSAQPPPADFVGGGFLIKPAGVPVQELSGYYAIKVGTLLHQTSDPRGVKGEVTQPYPVSGRTDSFRADTITLPGAGPVRATLRACRVGDLLWTGYLTADNYWQEVKGIRSPGTGYSTNGLELPDLADEVIVGLAVDNWDSTRANSRVTFEGVRLTSVTDINQCDDL